jgi:chloride channel protein, CIC family
VSRSRLAEIASPIIRALAVREDTVMLVLAVAVGALTGATTALFSKLVHMATDVSFGFVGQGLLGALGGYAILLLPVLGGLIGGVLVHVFAPEAGGNGVPQVMEAVALRGGRIRPIVVVIKSVASAICIGSGGSAGREGPIVQIGAGVGSTVGQVLGLSDQRVRNLVACGAAAGIAAAFNAPIAGVFFALEVIVGDFSGRAFSTVVIAAVIATVVATGLLGNEVPFVVPDYNLVSAWELLIYVLLGLACALVGVLFIRALHASEGFFGDRVRLPRWLKPALGGLGVGAIGLFAPQVMGTGHHTIDASLLGQIPWQTLALLVVLKIAATSLTLGSGGAGGDMAPSLFVGAMLGGLFGHFANEYWPAMSAPAGAYALVGMAALFSATARAPITAVLMLFEMTRNYDIILPLMFAVAVSTVFASILHRDGIYDLKLKERGIDSRGGATAASSRGSRSRTP